MENWVLGTKMVILLYCILQFVIGDMAGIPFVLLSLLVYICVNMLHVVFRKTVLKTGLLLISCAVLIISARFINPFFLALLPLNVLEISAAYTGNIKIRAALILIPGFLCDSRMRPEYFLAGLLSLIVFALSSKTHAEIKRLNEDNDRLREKNDTLYGKLELEEEYENQLKYLSQLEERNSLAQKIHDRVGHTIAGSLIQLEAASMILDSDHEKAGQIIGNVICHLKDGMEGIRSALRSIKPAPEQLGINRLKVMLDEFSMSSPIKTSLTYKGGIDVITNLQWKTIIDNTKEALTNTLKYASANMVQVSIEVMNKVIRAEVRDNGVGAYTFKKGLGIAGMEERTENAGGKLVIDGSRGFSIITLLPVSEVGHEDKNTDS